MSIYMNIHTYIYLCMYFYLCRYIYIYIYEVLIMRQCRKSHLNIGIQNLNEGVPSFLSKQAAVEGSWHISVS